MYKIYEYCDPDEFLSWAIAFAKEWVKHRAFVLTRVGISNNETAFREFRVEFPISGEFAKVAEQTKYTVKSFNTEQESDEVPTERDGSICR